MAVLISTARTGMQNFFQQWIVDGGVIMIALVPCLILTLAFVIQAGLSLRRMRLAPEDFLETLLTTATQSGAQSARTSLDDEQHSLAQIVRNVDAETRRNSNIDSAAVIREEVEAECDLLLQQSSPLGLMVRIAPLLGLLGTLIGLHGAFGKYASGAPDMKELSTGINGAMVPMVWGLLIAIIAYLAHYIVQRRIAIYEQSVFPEETANALKILQGGS